MEPPFPATELRKRLLWLTLECFRRNSFKNRSIGLVGLVVGPKKKKRSKWAWFGPKVGMAFKNLHATVNQNPGPLLEILDPPLT